MSVEASHSNFCCHKMLSSLGSGFDNSNYWKVNKHFFYFTGELICLSMYHLCIYSLLEFFWSYSVTVSGKVYNPGPSSSRQTVSNNDICVPWVFIGMDSIFLVLFVGQTFSVHKLYNRHCWVYIFVLLINVIECLVVVLLVILMHKRKLMILRQSSVSRQTLRKMTLIVTLIIGIFLFFRLIDIIFRILHAFFKTEFVLFKYMFFIVNLIALINFSSNPYILFMQHFFK